MKTLVLILVEITSVSGIFMSGSHADGQESYNFPSWAKNNARWWSQGQISDGECISAIQYLIQKGVIQVPSQYQATTGMPQTTAETKNNARLWATGNISNEEFGEELQHVIHNKVLSINQPATRNNSKFVTGSTTTNRSNVLSYSDLLSKASSTYADGNVPLGDGKYVTSGPRKGYIYLCNIPPMG